MSLAQIEKTVEEILSKNFDTIEDFDKEIEPHFSGDFKSKHYFIKLMMSSDNTEIKNKIFESSVVTGFLKAHNQRLMAVNIFSSKKYGAEEIYQDEDRIFLLDLYPWGDFPSPIKGAVSTLVEDYQNKEIIFYDIDNTWKIIKVEIVRKIDDEHEKVRQEILAEAASGKFDPEVLAASVGVAVDDLYKNLVEVLKSAWLCPKYKEEKVTSVEDYSGWIPDNFQQVLITTALTHS